jgi:hypothetical protein
MCASHDYFVIVIEPLLAVDPRPVHPRAVSTVQITYDPAWPKILEDGMTPRHRKVIGQGYVGSDLPPDRDAARANSDSIALPACPQLQHRVQWRATLREVTPSCKAQLRAVKPFEIAVSEADT